MPRPSQFISQTAGLFIRSYHWQRRQYCTLVFNFIVPPVLLVLLSVLQTLFDDTTPPSLTTARHAPPKPYAPTPFPLDVCTHAATMNLTEICRADPFLPKYTVPLFAQANVSSILSSFSLNPIFFPGIIPDSLPVAKSRSAARALLLAYFRDPNSTDFLFAALNQPSARLDEWYQTKTEHFSTRKALFSYLYKAHGHRTLIDSLTSALSVDSLSNNSDGGLSLSLTVLYNNSARVRSPMHATLTRSYNSLYSYLREGKESLVFLKNVPHTPEYHRPGNSMHRVIPAFIGMLTHLLFPSFLKFLVMERVGGMRSLMLMMGLRRRNYFIVTHLSLLSQYVTSALIIVVVGLIIRIPLFSYNTVLSYLPLLFLWYVFPRQTFSSSDRLQSQDIIPREILIFSFLLVVLSLRRGNALISLATLITPFFTDSETAMTVGWLFVFLVNLVGSPYIMRLQLHFFNEDRNVNMVGDPLVSHTRRAIPTTEKQWASLMIFPSFTYFRSLYFPALFNTDGRGVSALPIEYRGVQLGMCAGGNPYCRSFIALAFQFLICSLLGAYFDRVLPTGPGARLHPLFFLGRKFKQEKLADAEGDDEVEETPYEDDVREENVRASKLVAKMSTDPFEGVVLDRMSMTYAGARPLHALHSLSMVIQRNEVLCILAHNGAGKTTTFKLLTGIMSPTSGTAYVFGNSIADDMEKVYKSMGVAPQHDSLWEDLTPAEHLFFYGRLRNISGRLLEDAVRDGLQSFDLIAQRKKKVRKLSGGMRRRLSVSIALLGSPDLVMLDEPSTGLDVLSREKLWVAIKKAQKDRIVMLTTHSLEEAEALSSRIAIMSDGMLRCVGSAEELKLRLGKGHHLRVSLPRERVSAFHCRLLEIAEDAEVVRCCGGNVEYVLPRNVAVSRVLDVMREGKQEYGVVDWAVHEACLEDVFLEVTRASREVSEKERRSESIRTEDIV